METINILILEDDREMSDLISDLIVSEGWMPYAVESAEQAWPILAERTIHIALVDHNLPGLSGRSFAQRLRQLHNTGILMVTAAGSAADRVLGLSTAADDYVVKPFDSMELAARIKALLRRLEGSVRHEPPLLASLSQSRSKFHLGDWHVDLEARHAQSVSNPGISLTSSEFALLEILAEKPGEAVDRVEILNHLGADDDRYLDRNVDVLVLRLRRKIEPNPYLPRHIQTRRGKGYVLVLDPAGDNPP